MRNDTKDDLVIPAFIGRVLKFWALSPEISLISNRISREKIKPKLMRAGTNNKEILFVYNAGASQGIVERKAVTKLPKIPLYLFIIEYNKVKTKETRNNNISLYESIVIIKIKEII